MWGNQAKGRMELTEEPLSSFLDSHEYAEIKNKGMDGMYVVRGNPNEVKSSGRSLRSGARHIYKIGKWTKRKTRLFDYLKNWKEEDVMLVYLQTYAPSQSVRRKAIVEVLENNLREILKNAPGVEKWKKNTRDYFIATETQMSNAIDELEEQRYTPETLPMETDLIRQSDRIYQRYAALYDRGAADALYLARRPMSQHIAEQLAGPRRDAMAAIMHQDFKYHTDYYED
jgi:hypothetical protein